MSPGNYVIRSTDQFNCIGEKGYAINNPPAIQFNLGRDTIIPYGDTLTIVPIYNLKAADIKQIT